MSLIEEEIVVVWFRLIYESHLLFFLPCYWFIPNLIISGNQSENGVSKKILRSSGCLIYSRMLRKTPSAYSSHSSHGCCPTFTGTAATFSLSFWRWPIPFELHRKRTSRLLVRGSVFYKSLIPSGFISLQISTLMKSFYRILTLQFVAARFGTFRNLYHEMNNLTARWLPCVEKGNIKFAYESYPN
jgi:hypothetical protein